MRVQSGRVRCSPLPLCKGKGCFCSLRVDHLRHCVRMFPKLCNLIRFHFYFFIWHQIWKASSAHTPPAMPRCCCCSGVCRHWVGEECEWPLGPMWGGGEEGPGVECRGWRCTEPACLTLWCLVSNSPFSSLTKSTKKIRGKCYWLFCSDKQAFSFNESAFCLICVFWGGNDEF